MQVYSHKQQYQKCLCMCGRLAFIQSTAFTFAKNIKKKKRKKVCWKLVEWFDKSLASRTLTLKWHYYTAWPSIHLKLYAGKKGRRTKVSNYF